MSSESDEKQSLSERVIDQMNDCFVVPPDVSIERPKEPENPPIFVVGTPRSGSTLLIQLVVYCFRVAYINNLHARFWNQPLFGASVASQFQDFESSPDIEFESTEGKTPGYQGPHEFGYFWRRWFEYRNSHELAEAEKEKVDRDEIRREWASMDQVFELPIAHKNGAALSLNIDLLADIFPEARFIHCVREPMFVMQSIYEARQRKESMQNWFSTKPNEYTRLKTLSPLKQCAGQAYFVRKAIEEQLAELPQWRWGTVKYSDYCREPQRQLMRIRDELSTDTFLIEERENTPPEFESSNDKRIDASTWERLKSAWELFESGDGF